MAEYGLDNAGSGFDTTDDELDSMFAEAMGHEEKDEKDDEADAILFGDGVKNTPKPAVPAPIVSQDDEPIEAVDHNAPIAEKVSEPVPPVVEASEPEVQEPTPEAAQRPAAESTGAVGSTTTPVATKGRQKAFSSVEQISRIIKVVDALRKLSNDEREVVSQFLTGGEVLTQEPEMVDKVLTVDPSLLTSMVNLKSAKGMETVDRVFFVIDLSHDDMRHLGQLVNVFVDNPIDENLRSNGYAREIVKIVDVLESSEMKYIEACEQVLSIAAEGE